MNDSVDPFVIITRNLSQQPILANPPTLETETDLLFAFWAVSPNADFYEVVRPRIFRSWTGMYYVTIFIVGYSSDVEITEFMGRGGILTFFWDFIGLPKIS